MAMTAIPDSDSVFGFKAVLPIHEKPINRLDVACFSVSYGGTNIYLSK